jgi:transcriptional regulator with XRE-family HTH domain
MGRAPRPMPEHLPRKLYLIRLGLGLTQEQLVERLKSEKTPPLYSGHVSEYERGEREPPLIILLLYARLIGVPLDVLVDDEMELSAQFRSIDFMDSLARSSSGRGLKVSKLKKNR